MEYMRTLIRFYVPTYKAAQPLVDYMWTLNVDKMEYMYVDIKWNICGH